MAYNLELFSLSDQLKGLTSTFYRYPHRDDGVKIMCAKFFDSMINNQQQSSRYGPDFVSAASKEAAMTRARHY